jgi:N-acetylmuramoyl-L-alanine amidase
MKAPLVLAAALALPAALHAQSRVLRVEGVTTDSFPGVAVANTRMHSIRALERLGATVTLPAGQAVAVLFGDTLRFELLSPFARVNKDLFKLSRPASRREGDTYLPRDFFVDWLPAHYPTRVAFRDGRLRLTDRPAKAPAPPPTDTAKAAVKTVTLSPAKRVVVIDAGHGGKDPGKVGPNGLPEKQITLAVARQLAAVLKDRGYEVHLTRSTDTLIALADRPRLANRWKSGRPATLFVSLHANSGVAGARGFETYFLSDARTADERRVAEMENDAVKYEERSAASDSIAALDYILKNLRNDFYMLASDDLAESVQQRLASIHPGPNRGVKQAGFRVLVGALMPAVLIEMAFISSPDEAQLLGTSAFQQKLAWGIQGAIDSFFESHEHLWGTETTK